MRRPVVRLAVPLVGGALVGCSLPPLTAWPVGLVGLALVVFALSGRSFAGRLGAGMLAGVGQFAVGLAWAVQFSEAGYVVLVIVESAILALGAALVPPSGPLRAPAAAGAFTLAEWVRDSWPFGGLPLGSAALGQVGGPLQFAARLGGPLIVVFTAVLGAGAVAELVVSATTAHAHASRRANQDFPALACLVACGALAGAGSVSLPALPAHSRSGPGRELSVALVQGGGQRGLSAVEVPAARVFDAAVRETERIRGHPELILWPEDVVAMGTTPFRGSRAERTLEEIARNHHATLVAGVTEDVGATRFRNEIVAISPSGRLVATFEKVHRVPFGEYVPYRSFFSHLANLSLVPRDAIPGHGSGMIATPAGRLAALISFEVFFADRGRSGVGAGGRVIIVPTNTSSYSNAQAPAQEIAASRLQALEEDRYVLQAAPTGYSAVINPSGAVLRETALSRPAVVEATVLELDGTTAYQAAGDLPVLIGSLVLVALGWTLSEDRRITPRPGQRLRRRRRSPSPREPEPPSV